MENTSQIYCVNSSTEDEKNYFCFSEKQLKFSDRDYESWHFKTKRRK